jgi:PAS domain S-box-containing protein
MHKKTNQSDSFEFSSPGGFLQMSQSKRPAAAESAWAPYEVSLIHDHIVQFYESDEVLCRAVAGFLEPGFRAGNPMIVIATAEHRRAIAAGLQSRGLDVELALRDGRLSMLDARDTLAELMVGGLPHPDRFTRIMGHAIQSSRTGREHLPVLAFGEMVDILWRENNPEAAIRLEALWNESLKTCPLNLFCAYAMNGFFKEPAHRLAFERLCAQHSGVKFSTPSRSSAEPDRDVSDINVFEERSIALEKEIRRREQVERALLRALEEQRQSELNALLLAAAVESANDAIITKTLDGVITNWNPGAERVFGYTAEEVIGKPVTILMLEGHRDEELEILRKLRSGQRIDHYETRRVRKDGRIIDISLTVSPIRDNAGQIIGASKIARDITDRKRIEAERDLLLERERTARREAESARLEAERANRFKDDFLAVLSHELRTPLNAIVGWASILSSRRDEESLDRAVDVITRNADLQKRLIDDLLDMSRILTGKMTIKSDWVDLAAVLNGAVDTVRPAIAAKGINLTLELDPSVPLIRGDVDRLQQVLWNLLSNSVKFTPELGTIAVSTFKTGSSVEITVRDSGLGISPEFLPFVFERFRQGDASTTRRHGGLGLGLAVVQYLVHAHGGTVWANSEGEGRGATMIVRLPIGH